ncbi:MAG: hypothetical protein CVU05_04360 [Bacteroidetes bacterium HGW-Bacteroidetes-21]|nr:MAG: hypothetical protein CVU05_04360 [Bacteroidetes bacterium HGW-Bacteroidetes-21]
MSTQNYKDAIVTLENIQKVTPETEEAYQRVTFFRALELFSNSDFEEAIINFDKSLNNTKFNRIYQARSIFWKGESYFRLNRIKDATREFNKFILTAGSFELKEFNTAHYNLGYCYFKQKDFLESASWFRKYTDMMKEAQSKTVGDAFARTGDCYFASRDYEKASTYYQKAIDNGKASVDYATFQKGFCLGLLKEYNQKIILMNQLITDYPRSSLVDDAWFEIGKSYVSIEEPEMAINAYQQLINDYPTSNLIPKAYLEIGMVNYNTDKNDVALDVLKKVVDFFPNTQESKEALAQLKNVYLELNQVEEYVAYMKEKDSKIDIRITEQDSLTYTTSMKVYMNADYEKASGLLMKYIDKFKEQGIFYANANFYLAESYIQLKKPENAVQHFSNVLSKPATEFTEPSLLFLGQWYYKNNDYPKALDYFTRLESSAQYEKNKVTARSGRMRCLYRTDNLAEARKSAISLLSSEKIPDELFREAHFIIGKDALVNNNLEDAKDEFELIAKDCKSAEQAEAKYLISKIYFQQGQYEPAEKEIFDFVKKNTPHQYWLGKSFLLLSDIYIQRKDNFQAKATLQSIMDNYNIKTDGITEEAANKLKEINEAELKASQPPVQEEIQEEEINLDNSKTE